MTPPSEFVSFKISFDEESHSVDCNTAGLLSYDELVTSTLRRFPNLTADLTAIQFSWEDDENDIIIIASDEELREALRVMPQDSVLFEVTAIIPDTDTTFNDTELQSEITTKLEATPQTETESQTETKQQQATPQAQTETAAANEAITDRDSWIESHAHIRCDGCGEKPLVGVRYQCTVRPDFDLCSACNAETSQPHPMRKICSQNANVFDHLQIGVSNTLGWFRGTAPPGPLSPSEDQLQHDQQDQQARQEPPPAKNRGGGRGGGGWRWLGLRGKEDPKVPPIKQEALDLWIKETAEEREKELWEGEQVHESIMII